ncbi:permease-like cell division protein FtsX [Desulfosarcina sp. OttesenSCG-928-A07]|nr:permease-like cell division protein FtsX [Desulfosarcina sp. OttesenSCG-928-A07]
MFFHIRKALTDIRENRFLNTVTLFTISLCVLNVCAFCLLYINVQDMFDNWKKGLRVMVYLTPELTDARRQEMTSQLKDMKDVQAVRFISKTQALALMKERMPRQTSLLENLRENPLPDAFEVTLTPQVHSPGKMESLAKTIESLAGVSDVEYGRPWIERFSRFFNLFKLAGYGLGAIFFMATIFITANTIRLILYTRREEMQIMRLVGATDSFINMPYYLEGIIQGGVGGLVGIGLLYGVFSLMGDQFRETLSAEMVKIRFLPLSICILMVCGSMATGLLSAFFSLKQFMKR